LVQRILKRVGTGNPLAILILVIHTVIQSLAQERRSLRITSIRVPTGLVLDRLG
jgi:hypothetical protein